MADIIVGVILVAVIGAAVVYIRKAKKKGVKCIGCPSGCNCGGSCSCHTDKQSE